MEVDLGAIRRNAERLAERAGVPLIAMLKGDAYGLGAIAVAHMLANENSVWGFGVATVEEGAVLRDNGIDSRLLCCTPVTPDELPQMQKRGITPSLSRAEDIEQWRALGTDAWHLAIDTGLNRAGARWDELLSLREIVARNPPEGAFTHFLATAVDDASRTLQESRFSKALADCDMKRAAPNVILHVDNSLGIATRAPSPYHLARPGMSLFGWPERGVVTLDPVLGVFARVIDIRTVQAGESVSYGGIWTAPDVRRLATISIGHADGYRRSFSNNAKVVINGTRCAVVGIVTMDMTMVDVSAAECGIGDVATLIGGRGNQRLELSEVAAFGDISPYELLVGFKLRLPHVYSDSSGP